MKLILILFVGTISLVSLASVISANTNIVVNGDFESGNLEPWSCHGCDGEIINPGHESEFAFEVKNRQEDWAGPLQLLNVSSLSKEGRYDLGYSIITDSPVEIQWMMKVLKTI